MTSTASQEDRVDITAGLNDEQLAAVIHGEGPLLIVAGPGSGKTRVLTTRIAYLIGERQVAPWNILALTFTNKAAREMRERIEVLVGEDRARWITMGTFHSFAARILRQYGGEIGIDERFGIYDTTDQLGLVRTIMNELDINTKQFAPRAVLSTISSAKSRNVDPATFATAVSSYWEEVVSRVYSEYQRGLKRRNALDFDDLLSEGLRLVREAEHARMKLRDRYQYVLVDEYQDTNHLQYLMVNELSSEHRNICVVGDPDQSIYGWRAADIRNILSFVHDYPEAVEIHLEQNYRSTPQILTAADGVISENAQRIERALRAARDAGEPIIVREVLDDRYEAQFIVEEIRRLEREHAYEGNDFAVLYRTNAQSRTIEEAFIHAGVPYQLIGGTRFYERREIRDVMALLRLLANPNDTVAFQRVVDAFPIGQGVGAKTIAAIESWCRSNDAGLQAALENARSQDSPLPVGTRAQNLLADIHETLERLRRLERGVPLTELFDRALEETGYKSIFVDGDPELIERWENVMQLRATVEPYDHIEGEERLTTFLEEAALVSDADTLVEDRQRVTLITLHAVKGLEFPVVFITGVEDGLIPHQRSIMENPDMLEEERRLFYVGITRARDRLYITHARQRSRFGFADLSMPSPFLQSIPDDVLGDIPTRRPASSLARRSSEAPDVSEPAESTPKAPELQEGQRVFHAKFGDGTVVKAIDRGDDQELVVDFIRHGQKRLMASLANLTVD